MEVLFLTLGIFVGWALLITGIIVEMRTGQKLGSILVFVGAGFLIVCGLPLGLILEDSPLTIVAIHAGCLETIAVFHLSLWYLKRRRNRT